MARRRAVRSLALLGLLLTGACRPLAFVGDSITAMSSGAIHGRFDPRYAVTVDGVYGAEIHEMDDVADTVAATHPWAVVVNLGTNDASLDDTDVVADFDALMAKFTAPTCRLAVTISTSGKSAAFDDTARELNAHIRLYAWLGLWRLIDWDDAMIKYFAVGEPYGPMLSDLVHPTTMGQHWLAQLTDEALPGCPA